MRWWRISPPGSQVPGANECGAGLITWPPAGATRKTASPRSLGPSGRKRKTPSIPAKPEAFVRTCSLNRCGPCVFTRAATSATASYAEWSPYAPGPARSVRDSDLRSFGSRWIPAPAYQPPSSAAVEKIRGSSHRLRAQELHAFKIDAAGGERLHDLRHGIGAVGNEYAVGLVRGLTDATGGLRHSVCIKRVFLQRHHATRRGWRDTSCWKAASTTVP